jgi:hypothetical protein
LINLANNQNLSELNINEIIEKRRSVWKLFRNGYRKRNM